MAQKTYDQIAADSPLSALTGTEVFIVNQSSVTKGGALSILSDWVLSQVNSTKISDASTVGKAVLTAADQASALTALGAQASVTTGTTTDIQTGTGTTVLLYSPKAIHDAILALAPQSGLVKSVNGQNPDGTGAVTLPTATTTTDGLMASADKTKLDGLSNYTLPAATTAELGGVLMAGAVADSVAADVAGVVADLNTLLASLRAAGVLAP